ncbi:MAG: acetyl-CoA carboxylase biotin carboxyl carrier protein subunit, partial [Blastochloris sp.]|nr:acetyl-CoA carboxylase biotin carboxyl carrier protein subunit [Blastochloris sp.]
MSVIVNGEPVQVIVPNVLDAQSLEWLMINHRHVDVAVDRDLRWIRGASGRHHLELRSLESPIARPNKGDGRVKAPIPGVIRSVFVDQGDTVEADQPFV